MNITQEQEVTYKTLSFSEALLHLEHGQRIARKGWNGSNMYLEFVNESNKTFKQYPILSWIGLKTNQNNFIPWTASQSDILAKDWIIV